MLKIYAFSDVGSNVHEPLDSVTREVNAFLEEHDISPKQIVSTHVESSHVAFNDGTDYSYLYTVTLVINEPVYYDEEGDPFDDENNGTLESQELRDFAKDGEGPFLPDFPDD